MRRAPTTLRRPRDRRIALVLVALLVFIGSSTRPGADEASASGSDEAAFVAELNAVRAGVGLPPLAVNAELASLARGHAQVMADAGEIFHANPISAGYTGPWAKMGENVGVGANVSVLVDAFVASTGHYANIVDPAFTEVGVGVVWNGDALYTTHRFLQLPGATPPTTTAPPTSTTAPPPPTTAPPPTTTRPSSPPTTTTTTTTTTLPPLPAPAVSPERIVTLLELLEHVGT